MSGWGYAYFIMAVLFSLVPPRNQVQAAVAAVRAKHDDCSDNAICAGMAMALVAVWLCWPVIIAIGLVAMWQDRSDA